MEKQGHPTYEEIGQDRTIVSKPLYPPHHPHITALREGLSRWRVYFLDPAAMREEVALKEVETLAPNGGDLAALFNTLRVHNPAQFQALEKTLHQMLPSISGLEIERTAQGFLTLTVHEDEMPLSSRLVSEGTLRVLGLLAITNPPRPMAVVGYEEPENGVNPARLGVVAELLANAAGRGTTQFIVNTHSPVLPEYFEGKPGAALLHCYKEGRRTRFERFAETGVTCATGSTRTWTSWSSPSTPTASGGRDGVNRC